MIFNESREDLAHTTTYDIGSIDGGSKLVSESQFLSFSFGATSLTDDKHRG